MASYEDNVTRFQEIANRGLQDQLDPDKRGRFDEAMRRGIITSSQPQAPPQMMAQPSHAQPQAMSSHAPQQEPELALGDALSQGITSLPEQATKYGKLLYQAVAERPRETATQLADIFEGYGQQSGIAPINSEWGGGDKRPAFQAFTQMYKDRYGGWENIKRTFAEDSLGMGFDASLGLGAVGKGLKAASAVTSKLAPVAEAVSTAGRVANPLNVAKEAIKLPIRAVSDAKSTGMATASMGKQLKPSTTLSGKNRQEILKVMVDEGIDRKSVV